MILVTKEPISPELVIDKVKTEGSGCVATYVGLIRDLSHDKPVLSVEYEDNKGTAEEKLGKIEGEIRKKWQIENLAICHRIDKLKVGDINFLVAIASAHRAEGFSACRYAVDRFKELLPTRKTETYQDGTTRIEDKK